MSLLLAKSSHAVSLFILNDNSPEIMTTEEGYVYCLLLLYCRDLSYVKVDKDSYGVKERLFVRSSHRFTDREIT